jgi:hypothetical protein
MDCEIFSAPSRRFRTLPKHVLMHFPFRPEFSFKVDKNFLDADGNVIDAVESRKRASHKKAETLLGEVNSSYELKNGPVDTVMWGLPGEGASRSSSKKAETLLGLNPTAASHHSSSSSKTPSVATTTVMMAPESTPEPDATLHVFSTFNVHVTLLGLPASSLGGRYADDAGNEATTEAEATAVVDRNTTFETPQVGGLMGSLLSALGSMIPFQTTTTEHQTVKTTGGTKSPAAAAATATAKASIATGTSAASGASHDSSGTPATAAAFSPTTNTLGIFAGLARLTHEAQYYNTYLHHSANTFVDDPACCDFTVGYPDETDQGFLSEYIRSVSGGFSDHELSKHVCGREWKVIPTLGVDVTAEDDKPLYQLYVQSSKFGN